MGRDRKGRKRREKGKKKGKERKRKGVAGGK